MIDTVPRSKNAASCALALPRPQPLGWLGCWVAVGQRGGSLTVSGPLMLTLSDFRRERPFDVGDVATWVVGVVTAHMPDIRGGRHRALRTFAWQHRSHVHSAKHAGAVPGGMTAQRTSLPACPRVQSRPTDNLRWHGASMGALGTCEKLRSAAHRMTTRLSLDAPCKLSA